MKPKKRDPIEYLHHAFNVLDEAVFVYDQDMHIRYFNAAAERITQFKREEVIGKKCVKLFQGSICLNNCALCMTAKTGALSERIDFQSPFIRKDGIKRIGSFHAGLLSKEPDGTREVLVALTDISEIHQMKEELRETHSFRNIIGQSQMMRELFQTIRNIAVFDSTVLLQGESGTGKELVAQAIHYESPRAHRRLIKVNCSAFSENLLESELFGHVRGAFTGAVRDRRGRFEEGHGGTLFIDEVGDLTPKVQVSLLRVIQEKEIERVGENATRKVDIRIIAASNKDLFQAVREGGFREDLYYRLNVIPIQLPPLRTRKEDIPYLVEHFIRNWKGMSQKTIQGIAPDVLGVLMEYDWPGNIRELENTIEHACVVCTADTIRVRDLPAPIRNFSHPPAPKGTRQKISREIILEALERSNYNQTRAARLLNLHRITLWRKMKALNIPG